MGWKVISFSHLDGSRDIYMLLLSPVTKSSAQKHNPIKNIYKSPDHPLVWSITVQPLYLPAGCINLCFPTLPSCLHRCNPLRHHKLVLIYTCFQKSPPTIPHDFHLPETWPLPPSSVALCSTALANPQHK